CANQPLLLTANVSGGNVSGHTVLWATGNGLFNSILNPATDTPKVNTTYVVKLSDNCSSDAFDTVEVIVLPVPKADFAVNPFEGCPPLEVTFTDLSTGHDTLQNTWKVGANEIKGITQYSHLFANTGKYSIGLNVSNSLGCTDFIQKTNAVTVFDKPTADFIVKPEIKEIEGPVYFYNQSQNASQYTWDMGDGNYLYRTNKEDVTYRYTDTGNLTVRLIAQNAQGCLDTGNQLIRIFDKINCIIPTGFTPNSDGLNNLFGPVCVGAAEYHLTIYNRWGQVLFDCENCLWDGTYDGIPVLPGIYMYKLNITGEARKKATTFGTVQVIR
ncbi:MAG TPA: PKD domain-containing protein, partial [Bacteroidia bacterium]|nr:PKD domain-containing protein [Bacteroidia bacterium]